MINIYPFMTYLELRNITNPCETNVRFPIKSIT